MTVTLTTSLGFNELICADKAMLVAWYLQIRIYMDIDYVYKYQIQIVSVIKYRRVLSGHMK